MLPWMEMPTKQAILGPRARQCPGVFYLDCSALPNCNFDTGRQYPPTRIAYIRCLAFCSPFALILSQILLAQAD